MMPKTSWTKCLALLFTGTLLLAGLAGCGDDGSGKGFRFPLDREPSQLDPQVAADAASVTVLSSLFEGLTRLDDEGKPVPGAADWTVSEDGLTYTFNLRESYWSTLSIRGEDTAWDEPTRVVADDFVFGMQRAVDPTTGSSMADQLYGIVNARDIHAGTRTINTLGVQAQGEDTVVITLTHPDEQFLKKLAGVPFMPCDREFFRFTGGRYGLEKQYILTNGPFTLTAWNHQESLLLSRHEGYHAAKDVLPAAVRYVIGGTNALQSLQEGTMDAATLTAEELSAATDAGLQLISLQDSVRSVYFNTRHAALANSHIRRALRESVQWDTIYGYLEEQGEPAATGYVAPDAILGDGQSYRAGAPTYRYITRVADAQTALGMGLKQLYPKDKSPAVPRLTVLAAEDEVSANLARYLVQSWQKNLNIYCSLELVSESALPGRLRSGSYQVAIGTVTASGLSGAENLTCYGTGASGNLTGYADSRLDAALDAALTGGRQELAAAESLLWEAGPSLPLSFPYRYYGLAANVEGVQIRPFYGGAYGSPFAFLQAKKWEE